MLRFAVVVLPFLFCFALATDTKPKPTEAKEKPKDKPAAIRVTVVVILATTENNVVDKKLTELAKEMKKRDSDFTGFALHSTLLKSIPVGEDHTFDLIDEQTLKIAISDSKDEHGRVAITATPLSGKDVSYTCVCDKFVPIITGHKTKDKQQLIVAINARPCLGKAP